MPRIYKTNPQSNRFKWDMNDMQNAAEEIKSGALSFQAASEKYNVPKTTLFRCVQGKAATGQRGPIKTVLNENQESELVQHIIELQVMMYGITPTQIRKLAYEFATQNDIPHRFSNDKKLAGYDWLYGFLDRHKEISVRTAEKTSISRLAGFNREQVAKFFRHLSEVMSAHQFPPEYIFNVDESGVSTVPSRPTKILSKKGAKQVGIVASGEKGVTTTIVCCFNASGTVFVPPAMIFKRKYMKEQLLRNAPHGTIGMTSPNGWITNDLFVKWLQHFIDHTHPSENQKILLIMDNHNSHCTLDAIEKARANNIILLTIPPHSSHKLQPLDKTFFSSLKSNYEKECTKFLINHPGKRISQYDVSELFSASYEKSCSMEKAVKGFKSCVIYPYNPDIFGDEDFAPSSVTKRLLDKENTPSFETAPPNAAPGPCTPPHAAPGPCAAPCEAPASNQTPESHQSSSAAVSWLDLSPIPSAKRTTVYKRRRRCQSSRILTSQCEDFSMSKDPSCSEKKKLRAKRSRQQELQPTKPICTSGPSTQVNRPCSSVQSERSEEYLCIFCGEKYQDPPDEDWIQCGKCKDWCHESCTNDELLRESYVCDFC